MCPKTNIQNRCHQQFPLGPTDFTHRQILAKPYHFGSTETASVLPSSCDQISVALVHKIGIYEFEYRCHCRGFVMTDVLMKGLSNEAIATM